jgi:hypothetical protein
LTLGDIPAELAAAPVPRNSGRGRTVIDSIRALINPSMGFFPLFTVSGTSLVLSVKCSSQTDVTLWDEDLVVGTVPNPFTGAGATPVEIDIIDDATLKDLQIRENDDGKDFIVAVGGPDTYGITLEVGGISAQKGLSPSQWSTSDEPGDPAVDDYGDVWHLFKITPDWIGEQFDVPGEGIRGTIVWNNSGTNGEREFGGSHPANSTLEFSRELPFGGSEPLTSRARPRIVIGKGVTEWEDMTDKISITPMGQGMIRLGSSIREAFLLKDAFDAGKYILVSIGVDGWFPLLKGWNRTDAVAKDLKRTKRIDLPSHRTETLIAETITGVDPDAHFLIYNNSEIIKDGDVPGFRNAAEGIIAKTQVNSTTVVFTTKGSILKRYELGDAILSVSFGDDKNKTTVDVWSLVSGLQYDLTANGFGIKYEALRILER